MRSNTPNPLLPVLALLLAATMWGVIWYPLRLLEHNGLHGLWATAAIYGAALLVGLPALRGHSAELTRQPWGLVLIALFSGWTNIAFILAVLEGHVVRVLLLFYLSPLWAVLLGWLVLRESLSPSAWVALGFAMSGAVLMLWEPGLAQGWTPERADWYAVSSGMAFAATNVMVRRTHRVSVTVKALVSWVGVLVLAGTWLAAIGAGLPAVAPAVWSGAAALGVFGIVVMTVSVQYGVTHMPVQRSAIILIFELVAGALSAQWLTDEVVQPREWSGGLLIVIAALIAALRPAYRRRRA